MRRIRSVLQTGATVGLLAGLLVAAGLPETVRADVIDGPSLVISQLKITSSNGQFITLYNPTGVTLDMSKYQLEYFNNFDLAKATSSRLIGLSGNLPPHSYYMVNDDALLLCYRLTVNSMSLGLSSTSGMVAVMAISQTQPGGLVLPVLQDYVGWSKTVASGAQTLPSKTGAFLQRQPVDAGGNPSISLPGAGTWQAVQPDPKDACNLISTVSSSRVTTGLNQLLPGAEPPVTIINVIDGGQSASLPPADIGLMAPVVTEILPNPPGTGTDATDEYVELYNPNGRPFDLTGFSLQSGTTTLHIYNFPAGTQLPAKSLKAFYSSQTKLTLSNSGGQVQLLDPFGNGISVTGVYESAKDGVAWALAKGKWYWTTEPTPGRTNVIKQPPDKRTKKYGRKVKGASDFRHLNTYGSNPNMLADSANQSPVRPWTLAIIGGLALLYGAYEYRADLANYFHKLRRNFRIGRRRGP